MIAVALGAVFSVDQGDVSGEDMVQAEAVALIAGEDAGIVDATDITVEIGGQDDRPAGQYGRQDLGVLR